MDEHRHKEISSLGGKKKHENFGKKDSYEELQAISGESLRLEDVLSLLEVEDELQK